MARGRARYQRGRVVATEAGGWEIHYNVYLTDPTTGKGKRHHRSRVVGYKPKMHRSDAEKILASELATINGGPVTRAADGTITFGNWMRNFYIPMRGANWRDATRRTNLGCLTSHVSNTSPSKTSLSFRCRCYSTGWLRRNIRTRLFTMYAI